MPINVEVIGEETVEKMGQFYTRARGPLLEGLENATKVFMFKAEARSKKEFLSGPRPSKLGVVTGRLRSGVNSRVTRDGANIEAVLGNRVKYAARWELGFTGTENVKAHGRFIKKAFGKTLATPVLASVGAFSRKVDVKAKAFLSPAVTAELPEFENTIALTMKKGLTPGGDLVE
jgi:phage gpG-like protein